MSVVFWSTQVSFVFLSRRIKVSEELRPPPPRKGSWLQEGGPGAAERTSRVIRPERGLSDAENTYLVLAVFSVGAIKRFVIFIFS